MDIYTQPFAAVSQLPAALWLPEKNVPDCWSTYIVNFVYCYGFVPPRTFFFFKKWAIWSNDYASKTRIKILCKKTCCIAPKHFPKSGFLSNPWKYRTLTRM